MVVNPFAGTANISFAVFNPNHTSNVGLHYPQGRLPSPWPILLLSIGISAILGHLGYRGAAKESRESFLPTHDQNSIPWTAIGSFMYSTLRLIFLLVIVSSASSTELPSPLALLLFLFSLIPYTWNPLLPPGLRLTAFIESLIVFGIMLSLVFRASSKLSDGAWFVEGFRYGNLVVTGGNCPYTMSSNSSTCQDMKKIIAYSGCKNWTESSLPIIAEPIDIPVIVFELIGVMVIGFFIQVYIWGFIRSVTRHGNFLEFLTSTGHRRCI